MQFAENALRTGAGQEEEEQADIEIGAILCTLIDSSFTLSALSNKVFSHNYKYVPKIS